MARSRSKSWFLASCVSLLFMVGCGCHRGPTEPESRALFGRAELAANSSPPRKAKLILAGTEIPIEIETEHDGTKLQLILKKNDEVFEEESYLDLNDSFLFSEGGGETYDPPIPLISYPGVEGKVTKWEGEVEGVKSSAQVVGKRIRYYFASAPLDALEVRVNITIWESADKSSTRELMFIIAPEKGVLQRSFGTASVREPISEGK